MATHIKSVDGYIIDNPNIDFIRCDGRVFSYDEVNTASQSNTANNVTINGGQSSFPLAYIDTDKTLEFTFASSQFDLTMFEMANASNMEEGDVGVTESGRYEVDDTMKIVLPFEVQAGSVKIYGQKEGTTTPETGEFAVKITAATSSAAGSTEVTFKAGDVAKGDTIRVSYRRRVVNASIVNVTGKNTTAKGELLAHWPVYSSGTDCTEASVKGYLHLDIFRVRVTALPGFDNSYKSASTNSITFSALDPKRADGKVYRLFYEPLDPDGKIVTKSEATKVDW